MHTQGGTYTNGGPVITGSRDTREGFYNAVTKEWEGEKHSATSIQTGAGYQVEPIPGGTSHTAVSGVATTATSRSGYSVGDTVKHAQHSEQNIHGKSRTKLK